MFVLRVAPYLQRFSQPHAVCEDAARARRLLDLPHGFAAAVPHELHPWAKAEGRRRPRVKATRAIDAPPLGWVGLTVHLVGLEFGDEVPVHLHHRLLGFLIFVQHQLGGDGTCHLRRLFHHNYLKRQQEEGGGGIHNRSFSFTGNFVSPPPVTYSQSRNCDVAVIYRTRALQPNGASRLRWSPRPRSLGDQGSNPSPPRTRRPSASRIRTCGAVSSSPPASAFLRLHQRRNGPPLVLSAACPDIYGQTHC